MRKSRRKLGTLSNFQLLHCSSKFLFVFNHIANILYRCVANMFLIKTSAAIASDPGAALDFNKEDPPRTDLPTADMTWTGPLVEGGKDVAVNGTIEVSVSCPISTKSSNSELANLGPSSH